MCPDSLAPQNLACNAVLLVWSIEGVFYTSSEHCKHERFLPARLTKLGQLATVLKLVSRAARPLQPVSLCSKDRSADNDHAHRTARTRVDKSLTRVRVRGRLSQRLLSSSTAVSVADTTHSYRLCNCTPSCFESSGIVAFYRHRAYASRSLFM